MPLRLTRLQTSDEIVDNDQQRIRPTPSNRFLRYFNKALENIESAINGLADAVARLTTAEGDINTLETSKADAGSITGGDLTMATGRVLGRTTASTGAIEELTLTQVLDLIGSAAQGDILIRGASAWARLGPGISGQFLKTLGAGANPAWSTTGLGVWSLVGAGQTATGIWNQAVDGSKTNVDFTGLVADELLLILDAVTGSAGTANRTIRVSTDNGSTFYNTSGDYVQLSAAGTVTNLGSCGFLSGATAAAATVAIQVRNTKGTLKFITSITPGNVIFKASASDINAIRVTTNSADTLNGGKIYLFGR